MASGSTLPQPEPATVFASALAQGGTSVAFGVPGGGPNLDVVGAFASHGIDFVLAHGETAACIMASTWGALTGNVAAAVVTRGPGAASAVNGAAQATLDRQPLLLVTDTVPSSARQRVPHQRLDQPAMFAPVTKASTVLGADATTDDVTSAIQFAQSWPAGAVHLDYDASAATALGLGSPAELTPIPGDTQALEAAADLIAAAERPIVIVGCAALDAADSIRAALASFGAPVLATYQAIGTISTHHDLWGGLFTNGASERPLLSQADLIITVGLDMVEPIPAVWRYDAPVVALSRMPSTDTYMPRAVEVVASDLGATSTQLLTGDHAWSATAGRDHNSWVQSQLTSEPHGGSLGPTELVQAASAATPASAMVTVDAGAHFLAIMPLWPVSEPRRLLISNGLATMGYAVPAAIGAALARPDQSVVALTGDGGLGMCLAELETIVRLSLPITVIVFNDAALSLIEIKQSAHHGGPGAVRYRPSDFAALAEAMGMPAIAATTPEQVSAALNDHDHMAPLLIDARIDPAAYPHLIRVTRG